MTFIIISIDRLEIVTESVTIKISPTLPGIFYLAHFESEHGLQIPPTKSQNDCLIIDRQYLPIMPGESNLSDQRIVTQAR
jgi:hypothetical protein